MSRIHCVWFSSRKVYCEGLDEGANTARASCGLWREMSIAKSGRRMSEADRLSPYRLKPVLTVWIGYPNAALVWAEKEGQNDCRCEPLVPQEHLSRSLLSLYEFTGSRRSRKDRPPALVEVREGACRIKVDRRSKLCFPHSKSTDMGAFSNSTAHVLLSARPVCETHSAFTGMKICTQSGLANSWEPSSWFC